MATVALNIYTAAYPSVPNNIEIRVYEQSDDTAVIASLNHPPPHTSLDTWSFPGLPRTNLLFRIFEMSGSSIIQQLGDDMDVVPGSSNGVGYRATEQIQADVTVGFTSGVNVVTFDGTSGKEDWRGWDIATLNRMGSEGDMKKGIEYSWNPNTGTLTLLTGGDLFGPNEWFNVDFATQVSDVTDSAPVSVPLFSTPLIKTADYSATPGDMGGLFILDPPGGYIEFSLPNLDDIVAGRLLTVEMRRFNVSDNKCGKIKTVASQGIDWYRGGMQELYICPSEFISFYKFIDPSLSISMWRVWNPFGNWLRVGEQVWDDAVDVINKIPLYGGPLDSLQYARLYNDYVLHLPPSQVCNYDDWATGNNKYKFSLANSSNPANAGQFHIPDRRNMFDRLTDGSRLPGDFQDHQSIDHQHKTVVGIVGTYGSAPSITGAKYGDPRTGPMDLTSNPTNHSGGALSNFGTETRPMNIAGRKYLLV